ncbi:hypothetical protein GR247_12795 [Rhizobium leguminosarum]|nr:hypothetical protein [Rhizobium leguminosarum]
MIPKEASLTLEQALSQATISIPDAGSLFLGLGRNASYNAARRGDFQTIKIGSKIVVPVAPLAAKVGLRANIGNTP